MKRCLSSFVAQFSCKTNQWQPDTVNSTNRMVVTSALVLLGASYDGGVRTESENRTICDPVMQKVSANGRVTYQQSTANYTFSVVDGF